MPITIPKAPRKQKRAPSKKSSKKFLFQSPKGMHDILPEDFLFVEKVEKIFRKTAAFFDFARIETPILEDLRLFERGTGITSEVVQKQMYVVKTRRETPLALRPEMTPGVLRAYLQNGLMHTMMPGKFSYFSQVFRHEQPQAGRFRQFTQFGFEVIGSDDPAYDAQVILATFRILEELKLKEVSVKMNSIGCRSCRPPYVKKLKEYYRHKISKICGDCAKRLQDNPLRILDCKEERCQAIKSEAPLALDNLCGACKKHFTVVLEFLDELKVPYLVDPFLVRGLDYYSRTVFEIFLEALPFALASGGRYDHLSKTLSGPELPGVGVAAGVERIIEAMKIRGVSPQPKNRFRVFLIYMGDQAKKKALWLIDEFFKENVPVKESFSKDSLRSQLRMADKEQVDLALILGQREVFEDVIILRDMKSGNQETIPLKRVVEEVKRRLK